MASSYSFSQKYETQAYDVILSKDDVQIRYYPSAAKIKTNSQLSRNSNFRKLFNYISGDNSNNEKIAMTTPVYMTPDKKEMEFVLPKKYLKSQTLPKSNNVIAYFSDPKHVASIHYSGYSNNKKEFTHTQRLLSKLIELNIRPIGNPYILSYDSPYKFYNRRNEIIIEIEYN
ncbi:MAG: hypothetical protein CMC79_02270 [Flavobacteriaceae bacterium]|nr:hypothetical protein [Flavobacteriaceae bacterium]|tara:strand:+ start:3676 stop:4191 length:516 start_codon:yes stop_codon:yes gene_type:complete